MASRLETPSPVAANIITGHFNRKRSYSTFRANGSADYLIIYTVSGLGRLSYGTADSIQGEITARPGDIILLRPGTLHDYGLEPTLRRWELLWAHFHPRAAWHNLLSWPPAQLGWPGLMRLSLPDALSRKKIRQRLLDTNRLAGGASRQRIELAMNALEEVLLWCDVINPQAGHPIDPRIRDVMDYVCSDLRRPADVDLLADIAGLSPSRFAHLFRQSVGQPPQQWVERQRIHRARQLLELTSMPIKQIAQDVGYDNPLYFTLRFTRHQGKSPRFYRRSLSR